MKPARSTASSAAPDIRITDGGRELRAYVTELGISVPDFCDANGLDRIQVQRVMNGERWKRISVDFAAAIEDATKGRITWKAFRSKTARPVSPKSKAA